jgi:hypothetical protein
MTDADIALANIADLDRIYEGDGHDPDSHAREILATAAAAIRRLQAEMARVRKQNDLLCEIRAAVRGKAAPTDRTPAARVIAWLEARFAERPEGWTPAELMPLARNAGYDLGMWFECPEVAAILDRMPEVVRAAQDRIAKKG